MSEVWVEYIWIGGVEEAKRVKTLRSKGRIVSLSEDAMCDMYIPSSEDIPEWAFDGSSTYQAQGGLSDIRLVPVCVVRDPIRSIASKNDLLVLCETYSIDDKPHETNTRHKLVEAQKKYKEHQAWFGFEQEYTLYDPYRERPLMWPEGPGFPAPQGRYYCGVGCDEVYGEEIIEAHTAACLKAGINIAGINAEVMPAQWEFQVGPLEAPIVADQLWLARWLLYKIAGKFNVCVKLDPKPQVGDWNGAGCHTNFSTKAMREQGGLDVIYKACEKLHASHKEHIGIYGPFNDQRLTGKHETCPITEFRYAPYDRGASIRIPIKTMDSQAGYLEDRRPAANIDPYEVALALLETICGQGFKPYREPDVKL